MQEDSLDRLGNNCDHKSKRSWSKKKKIIKTQGKSRIKPRKNTSKG